MPVRAKARVAIEGAEFPEGGIPGCGVGQSRAWARGNQPALNHLAQKPLRDQALAILTPQLLRLEDSPAVALQFLELRKRSCELFARRGHGIFLPALRAFASF